MDNMDLFVVQFKNYFFLVFAIVFWLRRKIPSVFAKKYLYIIQREFFSSVYGCVCVCCEIPK